MDENTVVDSIIGLGVLVIVVGVLALLAYAC